MSLASTRKSGTARLLHLAATIPALQVTILLFIGWWVLLALFYNMPQIDLATAAVFFSEGPCPEPSLGQQVCGGFTYAMQPVFVILRQVLFYVPTVAGLGLLLLLVISLVRRHASGDISVTEKLSLLLGGLLLGPLVLVNMLLKAFSGRPRPYQTDIFGGNFAFMPAGSFAGQCDSNCSFISGEAAGAGWILCLIPLIPARYRLLLAPPIVVVALVTPALRVAFGGHYLSDVVLGWWSSLVVMALLFGVAQLLRLSKKHGMDAGT